MTDRIIKALSVALALCLHLSLLYVSSRQYSAASTNPERSNAAARTIMGQRDRPIRFVYVRDTTPSKQPPMDPSRASDMQRRGASPDGGRGKSPDPTSIGNGATREPGGMGKTGPTPRPARPPSPRGGATAPGRPSAEPTPDQKEEGRGAKVKPETSSDGKLSLPAVGGGATQAPRASSPGLPPQPQGMGVGGQLQQLYMGSMQGGYHNPNASRLNAGAVSFDTAGWDLGPYARQVQERVQTNWRIPEAQEVLRQKGWVAVHFVVHKDGRVTELEVIRPSGIPSYDQSAMNALKSSSPLPPLPPEVTVPQITGTFRFYYNMPIMEEEE